MPKAIRVGVVGCGEVAQVIHLPTLRDLSELFEVSALCDVSGPVLERVGDQWPSARRYLDPHLLIDDNRVDAVLIANPHVYHAAIALAAMRAGKHVLIEKPMCVNLVEADALLECERRSGGVAQVGFMRRYAPAFVEAAAKVSAVRSEIILARVHDVIGANSIIIDSTSSVFRDVDRATALADTLKRDMAVATELAIGGRLLKLLELMGSFSVSPAMTFRRCASCLGGRKESFSQLSGYRGA
jgi:predicted dehydrogenase